MTHEDPGQQPSEEELRARLEEELRRITVRDVLLQTVVSLVNLAGQRLGLAEETRELKDLDQVRMAIEGVRALLPLIEEQDAEQVRPVRDALSQLQMAYVRETESGERQTAEPQTAEPQSTPQEAPGTPPSDPDEAQRAKARAKIWTPPGS